MLSLPERLSLRAQSDPRVAKLLQSAFQNSKINDCLKAVSDFTELIGEIDDIAELYMYRGFEYLESEKYSNAISDFDTAVELSPSLDRAWLNLGGSRRHNGDIKGAYIAYCEGIKVNPYNLHLYYNRGWIKYYFGDFKGARNDWLESAKLGHPEAANHASQYSLSSNIGSITDVIDDILLNFDELVNEGIKYEQISDFNSALGSFNKAKKLYPKKHTIDKHIQRIYNKMGL